MEAKEKEKKNLIEIIEKVIKGNNANRPTFIRFSGHVDNIEFEICKSKWVSDLEVAKTGRKNQSIILNYKLGREEHEPIIYLVNFSHKEESILWTHIYISMEAGSIRVLDTLVNLALNRFDDFWDCECREDVEDLMKEAQEK